MKTEIYSQTKSVFIDNDPNASNSKKKLSTGLIIGIASVIIVAVVAIIITIIVVLKKRRYKESSSKILEL